MKPLLITAAVAVVIAAPVAGHAGDKDKHHGHRGHAGYAPPGQIKKAWRQGERLPVVYVRTPTYYVVEPARYRLAPPPPGYRWVLVEDDAYLARTDTGLIAQVVMDLLR